MIKSWSSAWRGVAALAILAGCPAPARAGYTITDLGVIAPKGTSGATAINASGQAAGMVTSPSSGMVAAESAGKGGLLQAVSVPSTATSSLATSINGGGQVAGYYTDAKGIEHGFYSSGGNSTTIAPLMTNGVSGTYTVANGINDGGTVVGTGNLSTGATRAFTVLGNTTTIIAPLASGGSNQGNGINSSGTVVGTSELSPGGLQHAFYTVTNGNGPPTAVDLFQRNAQGNFRFNTYGMAIANDGDIVGYGDVGGSENAFFASHSGGALVDLSTLGNASSSMALAVNDRGVVVGVSGSDAFLWDASDGITDLNSLLSATDQSKWTLSEATGINDAGQISGEGYVNGVLHGFVLTPSVPEPPALLLSAMGLAFASGWARFRSGRTGGRGGA
jgi:hypothetical protein